MSARASTLQCVESRTSAESSTTTKASRHVTNDGIHACGSLRSSSASTSASSSEPRASSSAAVTRSKSGAAAASAGPGSGLAAAAASVAAAAAGAVALSWARTICSSFLAAWRMW